MIYRKEECRVVEVPARENGRGSTTMTLLYDKTEPALPPHMKLFAIIEVPPNTVTGLHAHHGEAEIVLAIEGQPTVWDLGKEYVLNPGDVAYTYSGEEHYLANYTDKPAKVIALVPTE